MTTADAIAEAAGASKATLYRHCADKATLVVAAFNERSGIDLDMIDTGSLPENVRQLMNMLAEHAALNISLMLTRTQAAQRDPRLRSTAQEVFQPHLRAPHQIIERSARRGRGDLGSSVLPLPPVLIGALFTPAVIGETPEQVTAPYLLRYLDTVMMPLLEPPVV